jgi:hypothetical protein
MVPSRLSPTDSMWTRWIDAELCAHRILSFFPHSWYMIPLDRCRVVCSWNLPFFPHREYVSPLDRCRNLCSRCLPIFPPQKVRDSAVSMLNRVLMESPRFLPTVGTWFCWINAESCTHVVLCSSLQDVSHVVCIDAWHVCLFCLLMSLSTARTWPCPLDAE